MRYVDCKVGQKVYVSKGQIDWNYGCDGNEKQKQEQDIARATTIVCVDLGYAERGCEDTSFSIVVHKPKRLGGYDVIVGDQIYKEAYRVYPTNIELVKNITPVKAYPHTCKICKAPARKISKAILCSRDGCKSKRTIKANYNVPYVKKAKLVGVDSDGYVLCPVCGARADLLRPHDEEAECPSHHKWAYKFLAGHKVYRNENSHYLHTEDGEWLVANN
jgi:hypothetical protein